MNNYLLISNPPPTVATNNTIPTVNKAKIDKEFKLLDIFSGFSIVAIILVYSQTNSSNNYWLFRESQWNGLTIADCVIPSLLFIIGFSIEIHNKWMKLTTIGIRIIILINIGIGLNLISVNFDFKIFRIPSIMLRIALIYTVINILSLLKLYLQIMIIILFLVVYVNFAFVFEVPNCGRGILTQDCFAGSYIDSLIFTKNHMISPTDPEGLLSTFSVLYTVYTGFLASKIKSNISSSNMIFDQAIISNSVYKENYRIFYYWFYMCIFNFAVSLIMLNFVDHAFNKKIYSLSFTFIQSSIHLFLLMILYSISDIIGEYKLLNIITFPFKSLGKNSFFVLIGFNIFVAIMGIKINNTNLSDLIINKLINSWINNLYMSSFLFSLTHLIIWIFITIALNFCRLYIRN